MQNRRASIAQRIAPLPAWNAQFNKNRRNTLSLLRLISRQIAEGDRCSSKAMAQQDEPPE